MSTQQQPLPLADALVYVACQLRLKAKSGPALDACLALEAQYNKDEIHGMLQECILQEAERTGMEYFSPSGFLEAIAALMNPDIPSKDQSNGCNQQDRPRGDQETC